MNPRNWSLARKIYVNVIFQGVTLFASYASGVYSPGITSMREELHVSMEVAQLGTSLYMFGMAIGALPWGPISQVVGRRPVHIISLLGMVLFDLGVCLAQNITTLLVCRALAGAFAAAVFVNVAGSIVDMTTERDRIPYNSMFRFMAFLGPPLAALLGAVAVHESDWRWNLRSIPIVGFVFLVIYVLTVPETYPPVLLMQQLYAEDQKREERLHHHSSLWRWWHKLLHALPTMDMVQLIVRRVIGSLPLPIVLLVEEPLVMVVCFYTSLLYGLLYGSLLFFPAVWRDIRDLTSVQVGYTYFAVIFGFLLSTVLVGMWWQNVQFKKAFDERKHTPELRIRSCAFSLLFVPVGLFIFGWTAPFTYVHWIGPSIGSVCFSFGMLASFNSWMAYMTDTYSNNTAAAISINTFLRCLLAGSFPLFTSQMVKAMTIQGAMSMFGGISVLLTGVGFIFAYYGKHLRHHSKHAVYG
ncbi:hypothetical protein MNAN1_002432 [Malassezia nana]|uniref:Major facilitator superfamily (MFS) profile domain-containing protein n=1 Tax=Malassezia nana TaxID=180528 RepID=A0AAF0EK53_9BASI|nr:hypothetical protein MNAN1_002432 [Malassezia nana]